MPDFPSGTVTFLFTDVEGSTSLVRELGDQYAKVIAEYRELFETVVEEAGGRQVDSQGDAFFVAFHRAKDAVAAAVEAQRALTAHQWPGGAKVRVRMGIHTGEPVVGRDSYVGLGVHRAARICAAGSGGQVLVSRATRELLRDDPPSDVRLRDLGEQRLKDFEGLERVFQVVAADLQEEFPALKTAVARESGAVGWDFRILGPLEVLHDGVPVALTGQKQRALLALLLVRANDVVPAERLIELLWGESPPRTAATSLQNFVSQLRKAIGPEVLETRAPGYRLRLEPEQLDLSRFELLVRRAREGDPAERARLLGKALALWGGTPLADFAYEPFAQNEIRRLEELRLAAVEERITAELELGRHAELTSELEALVAEHPQRERLRGQLMLALYRSGRQAEALKAYQDARRTLVDELGIEPGPELQRLNASILRQESSLERVRSAQPEDSIGDVVRALLSGRVVPVLGPRAEAAGAPDVVEHLVKAFDYGDRAGELTRVSQYVATISGEGPLYDALHDLYGVELAPGRVHRFLASLPPILRARGAPHQLIVTTAYDLALEQAFDEAGEEFDVVVYLAAGRNRGKFLHLASDRAPTVISEPNLYATELSLDRRTVILRVHGRVDRDDGRKWESFVVTEDDYIGYLAPGELASVIPVALAARLRRSHFLFLGYALRDWHLRLLLNRLWGDEKVGYRSWSVQPDASALETEFWRRRDVDLFELGLDDYVNALEQRLTEVTV